MKKLPNKIPIILLSLLFIILSSLGFFSIYFIKNKSIATAQVLRKIEEGNNNSILIQSINSAGSDSSNDLAQLDALALTKDQLVGFIEELEILAKIMNVNIKIVSVNSEPGKGADNPDKIHLNIETIGSWSGNIRFLHAIEYLPYRTMINNSKISTIANNEAVVGTSTTTQKNSWRLATDLSVYSFK